MARILRGAVPLAGRRVAGAVHEATAQARRIVAHAEDAAARLCAEAEARRDGIHADACEAGRQAGLGRAAAMLAAAGAERARLLDGLEREVAFIALDVAGRMLGRELAVDPATVVELAARALAEVRERRDVVLRVNPSDLPHVTGAEGRLSALLARAPGLAIVGDAALARGAVVVETEAGRLDGGIEAQLEALGRGLAEVLP